MNGADGASLETVRERDLLHLSLSGSLRADTVPPIWQQVSRVLEGLDEGGEVRVDAAGVGYCDGTGIGMLLDWERRMNERGASFRIDDLDSGIAQLLDAYRAASREVLPGAPQSRGGLLVRLGAGVSHLWRDLLALVEFVGELIAGATWALLHPRKVRWRDGLRIAEHAGAEALPIVGLISFLIGLIIAFQGVLPLREFGAETFVADLTAFSLVRELGPLITAIILAGRSGAAFAAEIGTMRISEEINALSTMGFSPMRFLVIPRVAAVVLMMPLLTAFSLAFGLLGGGLVYMSLGYTHTLYFKQITATLGLSDLLTGLIKATVFGLLVAAVGCLRGLQTRRGASDVGRSATRAVVSGITLIVIADGVFTIFYYVLGV